MDDQRTPIRVLVIDRAEIFRVGIRRVLAVDDRYRVLGDYRDWHDGASTAFHDDPEVVIIERAELASLRVDPRGRQIKAKLLVTALSLTQSELKAILDWGVRGVVLKSVSSAQLLAAIDRMVEGYRFIDGVLMNDLFALLRAQGAVAGEIAVALTEQEHRLLPLLAEGLTNKTIAERLGLSDKTIKNHVAKVFRKLYVANRAQFAAEYARGHYSVLLSDGSPTPRISRTIDAQQGLQVKGDRQIRQ